MAKAKIVKPAKAVRLKAWEPIFQVLMTGEVVKKEVFENLCLLCVSENIWKGNERKSVCVFVSVWG